MKKILVPTDFSDNAKNALDYAVKIAGKLNAEILLMHAVQLPVIDPNMPGNMMDAVLKEMEDDAKQKLKKTANEATEKTNGKIQCKQTIRVGFAVEEIVTASADKKCDMIIMGTKGASGLKEIMMGSNTASVIEKTRCTVFAIPEKSKFKKIEKVVYATDFKSDDLPVIRELVNFAKMFDSHLSIIHIHPEKEKNVDEKLDELFIKVKYQTDYEMISFHIVNNEKIVSAINTFSEKNGADVLALATYNRGLFETLFHNSVTKQIAYHTSIPLLAFHKSAVKQ